MVFSSSVFFVEFSSSLFFFLSIVVLELLEKLLPNSC